MGLLGQLVINGIAQGAVYALMAVGFAIIYNATRIFHLAHGAVLTFACYCCYLAVGVLGWSLVAAAPVTIVAGALLGCAIELGVYAPLRARGAGPAALMIASLGLLVLLQNLFGIVFTTDIQTVRSGGLAIYRLGPFTVTSLHVADLVVAFAVFALLQLFLARTKAGRAIRALADNPELAPVVGIEVGRTYLLVMAIGSALASVAALLLTWDIGVTPEMGFTIVFFSAVACVIGGAGYLPGALLGAFVLGLIQQLSIWQLDSRWQNGVVFAIVLLFLALRPQGLFGGRLAVRRA
jgi:branched-chain amino acid transport system permease protein